MGCATSKVDDLPAVVLCRDRCGFLDEAINQRFIFADAHKAYVESLKSIGDSLCYFIQLDSSGSPLNLPPHRKGGGGGDLAAEYEASSSSPKKAHLAHHSHSNSGSHLHFHSDSDDDDDDDSISHFHHSDDSSPLHDAGVGSVSGAGAHVQYMGSDYMGNMDYSGGPFLHMNYMKNKTATPNVVYEQRPMTSETVHIGDAASSSTSSFYYPNSYSNPSQVSYFGYPNYGSPSHYGSSSSSSFMPPPAPAKPPTPPPPPPASPWDFLNFFESQDSYGQPYTPGRDLKELREEEGIPDLEDENYQNEVVKKIHGHEKYVDDGAGSGVGNFSAKSVMMDEGVSTAAGGSGSGGGGKASEASLYQARPSAAVDNDGLEYEVHVVEKKVVDDERPDEHRSGGGFRRGGGGRLRDVSEVAYEIKVQFERASASGQEIAMLLEVGRLPYHRKHVAKILHGVAPSLSVVSSQPSTSKSNEASSSADKAGPASLEIDEDLVIRSKNLASTLQKLYFWEKKLYNEVKAEEKMRVVHDRKCRKLKSLSERGAEAPKIDATRVLIRSLSTKIRIAIQVVDKTSITINKIRDEQLWPQLNQLIQGLTRMWKSMLDCHQCQCQAIKEAKGLGSIGSGQKLGDDHLTATLKLEHDILSWTSSFSSWVGAQKGYVKALNNWLSRCLLYEPEETADGVAPFSPGRMGAPAVFVICNQWAQAMDIISEQEVIEAMRSFASSVLKLWEQDKLEMRQRMVTNKDLERKVRNLDREDQRIHKEIQALDKKILTIAGDSSSLSVTANIVYQSDTSNSGSLHESLRRIFEAIEKFMAKSMKAYEELIQRSEEERLAQEHDRVS